MEFLKIFGIVAVVGASPCVAIGLVPYPVAVVAALGVLGVANHHHRSRSLL